jgi:hypothetical protein
VGKTAVYSAGITILAAFPCAARFLTRDAVLLVHERRVSKKLVLEGPMQSLIQIVREQLAEFETSRELEIEGFRQLVAGSRLRAEELYQRATENCYIRAEEALELNLIAEILD